MEDFLGVLPYYLLLLFVAVLGFFMCELKKSKKRNVIFICIITLVMVAMAGLRNEGVGIDYNAYWKHFVRVSEQDFTATLMGQGGFPMEPGFRLLAFLVSRFTADVHIYMAIVSAAIIVPRMIFVYRNAKSVWIGAFVYVSFGFFGYALCTLRQELGITVAMFALPYLQKKKILPYFLIIALAGTFHTSLWILLPCYFLAWIPLNWKSLTVYLSGTAFILLFSEVFLDFITDYVYQGYKPGSEFTQGRSFNTAFIPIILFLCVMLMKKRLLKHDPSNVVFMNFSCYAALLFALTIKHFVFQRVALVFLPAALLLVPAMLSSMEVDESKYTLLYEGAGTGKAGRNKQLTGKILELKKQRHDEKSLYYLTMGFILFGSLIYFMFLQNANRLLLIPYRFLF